MTVAYRRLFESAPDLYLALTPDLTIIAASDAYLQATMTRREQITGRPLFAVFPDNPGDPAATGVGNLGASLRRVLETRQADVMPLQKYDIARPAADGGEFEVRYWSPVNTPVLDEAGAIINIIHRVEDVTESVRLKLQRMEQDAANEQLRERASRMEARFRSLLEAAPDAIVIIDRGGHIQLVNRQAEALFGYGREELLGQPVEKLMPARFHDAHPGHRRLYVASPRIRAMGSNLELCGVRRDGTEFPVEVSLSMLETEDGTLLSSAIRDITERKRIEQELRDKNVELESAGRAKSLFLASMSHEIRTPMNGIIGTLDVLQQSSLMGPQAEMVDLIRESAQALLEIIDDILDLSKIEAGRLDIEHLPMQVAEELEKAGELLNSFAERKGGTLMVYADPAIPARLLGDAGRLRQILINLISNAIKFSSGLPQAGLVNVRAVLAERHSDHAVVEFRVTDNGIGMDEPTLARVFTTFTQADPSTTRRYGGTGLGLSICRQLVSLMDGSIEVSTKPQHGSTFSVRLPFPIAADVEPAAAGPSEVAGLTCLVIGGDTSVADDLAAYLAADGATVRRLPDLAAAREWCRGNGGDGVVWVMDAGKEAVPPQALPAATLARAELAMPVGLVIIGRGRRRNPRVAGTAAVTVDGNALSRRTLARAVAIAAGRREAAVQSRAVRPRLAAARAPERAEAIRQRRLILVAEDNEINQNVIRRQLNLLGYAVDIAANGREALARWQTGDYALLLTDLHMPEMDGYGLAVAIRGAEAGGMRTPIIALTANALRGESERCLAIGMDDYLSKPAPLASLAATIQKWLQRSLPDAQAAAPAPVDVRALEELVGADPAVIADVLGEFARSAGRAASEIAAACAAGKVAHVAAIAHQLKSSARSVGAATLADLSASVEQAARAGELASVVALQPAFDTEMRAVDAQLGDLQSDDHAAAQCA